MAIVTFKAKARTLPDGRYLLEVPVLRRAHCDMASFRTHPKFGPLANSDLLPNILAHARRRLFGDSACLFSDRDYEGVTVTPGFLHQVTITL